MSDADRDGVTPSQTVGPYFKYGLVPKGEYAWSDAFGSNLVVPNESGKRIRIEGVVFDGEGVPVRDCMLEIWQADSQGRVLDPNALRNVAFGGFGRCGTDEAGRYSFETIKPGAVAGVDGEQQAPHIVLAVFARGMLRHHYSRIYFEDDPSVREDPVLMLVPPDRRATLIARVGDPQEQTIYHFDIRLQGKGETAFFDV
jgi:protocatechuate 3,4-dioxygenase alpha subunit